ncbi:MAG: lipopolysaccharide heptosyltransferase I [Pseudomonadota bacterium]
MPRILLVKTSSMGDVIHNLPIISDIRSRYPNAEIDWLVEESFAEIPALHPGVAQVIPVAIRRWRKTLYRPQTWREMRALRARLAHTAYDFILDTQGLLKSGLLARLAHGERFGLDHHSAREPLAALCYDKTFAVDPDAHAVVRYRTLAARAFDLAPDLPLDYGVQIPNARLNWLPAGRYAVLLHATSRAEKLWPEADWLALGHALQQRGVGAVLPWGGLAEYERAQRLAGAIPNAIVAPRLTLKEAALLLKQANLVVGVDTGLVHLATAVGTPTIGIYGGSDPAKNGLYASTPIRNLGGPGSAPSSAEVIAVADEMLSHA